ncbi:MAG: penicillin acylase family protein [Pseudohongiellaceae bacterium]
MCSRQNYQSRHHRHYHSIPCSLLGLVLGFVLASSSALAAQGDGYSADIVWTEYGIPHVTAEDWGSLGYGFGYAFARHNYCVVMKEFVRAAGESARYLGEEGDFSSDLVMKLFNDEARIREIFVEGLPAHLVAVGEGYVAGLNRYLDETGVDGLAGGDEGCRGAEWVREVDVIDFGRLLHRRVLRGSSSALARAIAEAKPNDDTAMWQPGEWQGHPSLEGLAARQRLGLPTPEMLGSNAYGVGRDATGNDSGLLFGNPHFPWQGGDRFYMAHLTIPGSYDVMGASLYGLPLITIGFNRDVAWSHTVSTASRFTFHELKINPDNSLEYLYDGEYRPITPLTVSVETLADDGSVMTVEHTAYMTHFGPMVDLGGMNPMIGGWPNFTGTAFAMQDANLDNLRSFEQWVKFGQATSMDELKQALRPVGIPWVNTIAADRHGDGFYGDVSTVPHVTADKISDCVRSPVAEQLLSRAGVVMLDGSDSACEWGSDDDAPVPGVFGYDNLPKLTTPEYAANANGSYWLANPQQLLSGFPAIIGAEATPQSLRTRLTFLQAEQRLAGTDGLGEPGFNNENVRQILTGARNYAAELLNDDIVGLCAGTDWSAYGENPQAMTQACEILAAWDKRHTIDSVGGHIFHELFRKLPANFWATPFNPADPVNTPHTLNTTAELSEGIRQALAEAVQVLLDNDIALDAPWGEVQFVEKNGERIPIHGGTGAMLFSVITSRLIEGKGYSNIVHGNSYVQVVSWNETGCPNADAILTYSQSTDPASDNYADATWLYSRGGWIDMPFCEDERDAQEVRRETVSVRF